MSTDGNPKPPGLLTIREAASYLNVSDSTIRRFVKAGHLKSKRVGVQIRFSLDDIMQTLEGKVDKSVLDKSGFDFHTEPSWARSRIRNWKRRLSELIPKSEPVKIVVLDRRGAKMFSFLNSGNFSWGQNLWHSSAIEALDDAQVVNLFAASKAILFDEMIQFGHHLHLLKGRLERLRIPATSICLIRRRSYFLNGLLLDPEIIPIEDLDDPDFRSGAAFISRLLARRHSPLNAEHVMVSGILPPLHDASQMVRSLESLGMSAIIWKSEPSEEGELNAFTLDRPNFFDTSQVKFPIGVKADFDGAVKIRVYHDPATQRAITTFFAFPTLSAPLEVWRRLISQTKVRYGADPYAITPPPLELNDPQSEFYRYSKVAYLDICLDTSLELLRQTIDAGFFDLLGVGRLEVPPFADTVATFGPKRSRELQNSIVEAIRPGRSANLFPSLNTKPLATTVVARPQVERDFDFPDARERLLAAVGKSRRIGGQSPDVKSLSYSAIMAACLPMVESRVSTVLDHEIDMGTIHPAITTSYSNDEILARRVYQRGEYDDDLPTYDDQLQSRTRIVSMATLADWLRIRTIRDEGELLVSKLLANLRHDWGDLPPIAMQWFPFKFGAVPSLPPPKDRPLLRALVDSRAFLVEQRTRQRRYRPADQVDIAKLFNGPACNGAIRARVKSLVKAYAAVQSITEGRDRSTYKGQRYFLEPLTVLASARNEATAYKCSYFEVQYWMAVGGEKVFPSLMEIQDFDNIGTDCIQGLRADISEWAQASRFLYEKINMYRRLPEFRKEMERIFIEQDLDAGEVILETVDREPRFSSNISETKFPIGLLASALEVIRPFTTLCRLILTAAGIDLERREKIGRTSEEASAEYVKDYRSNLLSVMNAEGELTVYARSLEEMAERVHHVKKLTEDDVKVLYQVFGRIRSLLNKRIPNGEALAAKREVEDRQRRDFIYAARRAQEITSSGYVAVADIYNFGNALSGISSLMGESPIDVAEKIQDTIGRWASIAAKARPGAYAFVQTDTLVIVSQELTEVLEIIVDVLNQARVAVTHIDSNSAEDYMYHFRTGIALFVDGRQGMSSLEAIIRGHHIAERHGNPRGYIAMEQACHENLQGMWKGRFAEKNEVFVFVDS
jgi:excisionase family DNA binding protein